MGAVHGQSPLWRKPAVPCEQISGSRENFLQRILLPVNERSPMVAILFSPEDIRVVVSALGGQECFRLVSRGKKPLNHRKGKRFITNFLMRAASIGIRSRLLRC